MNVFKKNIVSKIKRKRQLSRQILTIVLVLSFLVSGEVMWKLRSVVFTLANDTDCGTEGHIHTVQCYDENEISENENIHVIDELEAVDIIEGNYMVEKNDINENTESEDTESEFFDEESPDAEAVSDENEMKQDVIYIDTGNGIVSVESNSSTDRYTILRNSSIKLIIYDSENTENYFYDPNNLDKLWIDNRQTITDGRRIVSCTITAHGEGVVTVAFRDQRFYLNIADRAPYVIYVDTALGQRDKDRVHEYLETVGGDTAQTDGKYFYNTASNPYILYPGESVDLSIYIDNVFNDRYFYMDEGDPCVVGSSNDKTNIYDEESGMRKSMARYTAVKPGSSVIKFRTDTQTLFFYVQVRNLSSYNGGSMADHADIEISDGGFYDITKTVTNDDGTSITTKTSYDSYITGVNLCELFRTDGTRIMTFVSSDYMLNGNPGESQYELTSKYLCMGKPEKQYDPGLVSHARFDVRMLLKPATVTVTKKVNGQITEIKVTDISDKSGNSNLTIQSVEFLLETKSKIDALNKCPDHSGLDFNVSAVLNDVTDLSPNIFYTDLRVEKSWSDGEENHADDKISFVIYRKKNNENEHIISIDGVSKFELSSSSGWSMTFTNLPVREGSVKYSYRVEEDTFEAYIPEYEPGMTDTEEVSPVTVIRIKNTLKETTSVSIRKEWTDSRGEALTGDIPYESVIAELKRDFKTVRIPVTVEIYSSVNPQQLIAQFVEQVYTGSDFSFTVYDDMSRVRVSSVTVNDLRNGEYNSNSITVRNIQYGDIVRVYCDREYDRALDGEIVFRHSFTGSREGWENRVSQLGDAYTTCYTDFGNAVSQALKVYNRTDQWNGVTLNAGRTLVPGRKYSISAYVLWDNVFTDSGGNTSILAEHTTNLVITLQYRTASDSRLTFVQIDTKTAPADTWTLLQNTEFEIPGDAIDPYLIVETTENISGRLSDIYIDEVIAAPSGTLLSVNRQGVLYIGNPDDYHYYRVSEHIPDSVRYSTENWISDTIDTWKEIELKAAENWTVTVPTSELDEKRDRIYRYYVSEKTKTDGFVGIVPDNRVPFNTVSDPLVIENRQILYELPATGGDGKGKFVRTGILIMILSVPFSLFLIIKKRRLADSDRDV